MRKPPIGWSFILATMVLSCLMVVAPLFVGSTKIWAASFAYAFVSLLMVFAIWKLIRSHAGAGIGWNWTDAALTIFWLVILLGYLRSPVEFQSRLEWLQATACLLTYAATRMVIRRRRLLKTIFWVLVTVGLLEAFYGIYQSLSGQWYVLWQKQYAASIGRASGTFICPNHFSGYLEICLPLVVAILVWGQRKPVTRLGLFFTALVLLGGIVVSHSRGGIIATAVALSAVFMLGARRKGLTFFWLIIVIGLTMAGLAIYLSTSNPVEYQRLMQAMKEGEWSRLQMWRSAWAIFCNHPWLGAGPMMFDLLHPHYRFDLVARAVYAHNDYFQLLADYGVLGAAALSLVLVTFTAVLIRSIRKFKLIPHDHNSHDFSDYSSQDFLKAFAIGGWGAFAAILAHSAVDFNMHIPANAMTLMIVMACVVSLSRNKAASAPASPEFQWARWCLSLGLIAVLLPFGFLVWKTYDSDRYCRRAKTLVEPWDWDQAERCFRRALAIDPANLIAAFDCSEFLYTRAVLRVINREEMAGRFFQVSEMALKANPYAAQVWVRRGEIYDLLGKEEPARAEFTRAVQFDPTNPFYLNKMGMHYKKWNQPQIAIQCFERAIKAPVHTAVPSDFARQNIHAIKEHLEER